MNAKAIQIIELPTEVMEALPIFRVVDVFDRLAEIGARLRLNGHTMPYVNRNPQKESKPAIE